MRILWVGFIGNVESDIFHATKNDSDLHVDFLAHGQVATTAAYVKPLPIQDISDPDLIICRYPTYWDSHGINHRFPNVPKIAWASEQGPTKADAMAASNGFQIIAVNNQYEIPAYKERFPHAKILYLPFGCVRWSKQDLHPNLQYVSDLIVDGTCHYTCNCAGPWKRQSVDTLVLPVLDKDIALWGSNDGSHGWPTVPWAVQKYRGFWEDAVYPHVYSSVKLYLGITYNWYHGGFGVKLGRALSTGIPVIWHKTVGMELEGLEKGNQLNWASTPEEIKELVDYYLSHNKERVAMGLRGKAWGLQYWDWVENLKRIVKEVA